MTPPINDTDPGCSCACNADIEPPTLLCPSSGRADVCAIADRAARKLDADKKALMSCLAAIGSRVSGLMASAAAATALIAIDGCPIDCATRTLQLTGSVRVHSVRATDPGFVKGRSPVTTTSAENVIRRVESLLSRLRES